MSEEYSYGWRDFKVRVVTEATLEGAYAMQLWCEQTLGDRWATTPPTDDAQAWYFLNESDALLFRLRWL